MIQVRVPATSANVGCGFDTLGVALTVYNTFCFQEIQAGYEFINCTEDFNNEKNLVYTSFLTTLQVLNKKVKGIQITFSCDIPMAGGLGSSSTCVVAGIYGAFGITNTPIDKEVILKIATDIEGHPDNVSPAIYGGLTASCMVDQKAISMHYNIDSRFHFLAIYPNFETLTSEARKVLPKRITFEDALYNVSRVAIVLKAFENYDVEVLSKVMGDRLHEPYRKSLIHEYDKVKEICRKWDSICFFISGSGSTLMNVMHQANSIKQIQHELNTLQYDWKVLALQVDQQGSVISYDG